MFFSSHVFTQVVFPVEVKDPGAPVDFYINGKKARIATTAKIGQSLMLIEINISFIHSLSKVSKNDNRCEYVNLGEGKHQLIIHKVSDKYLANDRFIS